MCIERKQRRRNRLAKKLRAPINNPYSHRIEKPKKGKHSYDRNNNKYLEDIEDDYGPY